MSRVTALDINSMHLSEAKLGGDQNLQACKRDGNPPYLQGLDRGECHGAPRLTVSLGLKLLCCLCREPLPKQRVLIELAGGFEGLVCTGCAGRKN